MHKVYTAYLPVQYDLLIPPKLKLKQENIPSAKKKAYMLINIFG